jgi:DNA-binding phage protein
MTTKTDKKSPGRPVTALTAAQQKRMAKAVEDSQALTRAVETATAKRDKSIIAAVKADIPRAQLARETGLSPEGLRKLLKRHGL